MYEEKNCRNYKYNTICMCRCIYLRNVYSTLCNKKDYAYEGNTYRYEGTVSYTIAPQHRNNVSNGVSIDNLNSVSIIKRCGIYF